MRTFNSNIVTMLMLSTLLLLSGCVQSGKISYDGTQPNIVLIITDDQGYGDLGSTGNQQIQTPNLDRFAEESTRFNRFYVSPVCAPTRASLMTGRYNYRTGVVDTYVGRAMMESSEITLAELLRDAGYDTGIFGKWHLGDTWPIRPMDQGFAESLVHMGGGIGQPSDPPDNTYFEPTLQHNGETVRPDGYCTDIFADAAIEYIKEQRSKPFFVYLATNAPHGPLQIDEQYVAKYRDMGIENKTARIYGMVENIDENVGKVLAALDETGQADNTIFIFMSDNGPAGRRYNAGLRGTKTTPWEGGIRSPFFFRWPAQLQGNTDIDRIAGHIDIMPTLIDAAGASVPSDRTIDGISLMPLLEGQSANWPDRTLFLQSHRGDEPQQYRNFGAVTQQYKLTQPLKFSGGRIPDNPHIALYDLSTDPGEEMDISGDKPDIHADMIRQYEEWFKDVSSTRGYAPVRILLGAAEINPVILNPQDWRGTDSYMPGFLGYYEVNVTEAAQYQFDLRFTMNELPATIFLKVGGHELSRSIDAGGMACTFDPITLEAGDARVEAWIEEEGQKVMGVRYVRVKRIKE
jgi:arylsulfatase A-like enzyme